MPMCLCVCQVSSCGHRDAETPTAQKATSHPQNDGGFAGKHRHCEVYAAVHFPPFFPPSLPFPLQLLPSIQNELPDIRDMALNCLGLACLLDISLARNHILLFLQVR